MAMTEARLVLLYALHTDGEGFAGEDLSAGTRGEAAMDGVDDKRPVHHLVAVEQVAVENELESGVLGVLRVVGGADSVEFQLQGEGLEPFTILTLTKDTTTIGSRRSSYHPSA